MLSNDVRACEEKKALHPEVDPVKTCCKNFDLTATTLPLLPPLHLPPSPPGLRQRLMLRLTDLPLNSQYRVGLFMNPVPESNVVKTRFLPVSVLIIELKSDDFNFDHTVWSKAPPPSGDV